MYFYIVHFPDTRVVSTAFLSTYSMHESDALAFGAGVSHCFFGVSDSRKCWNWKIFPSNDALSDNSGNNILHELLKPNCKLGPSQRFFFFFFSLSWCPLTLLASLAMGQIMNARENDAIYWHCHSLHYSPGTEHYTVGDKSLVLSHILQYSVCHLGSSRWMG